MPAHAALLADVITSCLLTDYIILCPPSEVSVTAPPGTSVLTVQATDNDSGNFGEVGIGV